MAGEWRNMAEIAIAVLSVALITFGTHGFDIMAKFRDPLRGKNVILKEDKLEYSKCLQGMVGIYVKNGIPFSAMTASTFLAGNEPYWARLKAIKWWIPSVHDKFQYLKVDLGSLTVVRKSAIQGSGDTTTMGARVTSYFLYYSKDDTIWYPVLEKENPRMFVGNLNNSEVISKSSFAPFLTRYVKFCPHSWIKRIALRVELYGCRAKGLDDPLGMEVKTIPDSAISATSMESPAYHPSNARLHLNIGGGGWCADSSLAEQPQYLQVDYESNFLLTAVATQGIKSDASCVTQYYLSTTIDHNIWIYVHDFTGKKVFKGCNPDAPWVEVLNHLPFASAIRTRGVRLHVDTWYHRSCLRVEFYGFHSLNYVTYREDDNLCGWHGKVLGSMSSPHITTCWCYDGYVGDGFHCADVDECSVGDNVCGSPDQLCKNNYGSFVCECQPGTTRNGNECKDIDECAKPRDVCPYLTECINTVGSYICDCKEAGFKADGKQCLDIDECKIGSHNCGENSTCVNAFGSYACFCNVGFTESYSLDGKLQCVDIDECKVKPKQCGSNGICVNTAGSYFCLCKHGYAAKGSKCQDLDECAIDPEACEQDSLCVNLPGSYACQCKLGYHLTDNSCHDVNECQQNFAECHHWADCYNTDGSYLCVCKKGFYGDGFYCSRKEQCSKEDEQCNAALTRQEERTGVKTAALKMNSGQDELKQGRLIQALLVTVAIKLLLCQVQDAILQFH